MIETIKGTIMLLPNFKYNPNPLETKCIEESDKTCQVCNNKRGYIATSMMSCLEDIYDVCPWCIADGSASKKYDGEFVIDIENPENLTDRVIEEISCKTVSFPSYQELIWLTHCNDGCEFLGHVKIQDFKLISEEEVNRLIKEKIFTEKDIRDFLNSEDTRELSYLLKFRCIHCGELKFWVDYD